MSADSKNQSMLIKMKSIRGGNKTIRKFDSTLSPMRGATSISMVAGEDQNPLLRSIMEY